MKQKTELNNDLSNNNIKKLSEMELNLITFLVQNKLTEINSKIGDFENITNGDDLKLKDGILFFTGIKSGYVDTFRVQKFAISFSGIISYYYKKHDDEYWTNIAGLYNKLLELDTFFREKFSKYIFSFEEHLESFLFYIIVKNKIDNDTFDYDLLIQDLLVGKHKGKQSFNKNLILEMSEQIHCLTFFKKIEFLKRLWIKNCFILSDLSERGFIHEDKIEELKTISFKGIFSSDIKLIDNLIFGEIIGRLRLTKKYRNRISHLDELVFDKKSVNNLGYYLIIQEDFLKNKIAGEFISLIRKTLNEDDIVSKINNLRDHFSFFLNYNENKN